MATSVRLSAEERKVVVDGLISNSACCWNESDRGVLNKLPDVTLAKMYRQQELLGNADDDDTKKGLPGEGASETGASADQLDKDSNEDVDVEEEATKPGESQAEGKDEPMGDKDPKPNTNALSERDRRDLAFARKYRLGQRRGYIDVITTNEANRFTPKQLAAMEDGMLANLAAMAAGPESDESFEMPRMPSFLGASAGVVSNADYEEEPLPLPKMNYGA